MTKKILWIVLFSPLLFSCQESKEKWELESVGNAPYSRMIFVSESFPKISLELLPLHEKICSFLTFTHLKIVPTGEGKANVRIAIDEKVYEKTGALYEGNQRISLDAETTELLIAALQKEKTVSVEVNGYKSVLPAHQFSKSFSKLQNQETPREISHLFHFF